jgi:four helix bundle protein
MPKRSFHRSRAAARALSFAVHNAADELVARRSPGLRHQLLRAAASVPANIAEAEQQTSDAQALNFLRIALGSTDEIGAHLETAADAGALSPRTYTACQGTRQVVKTMLQRLIECLERDRPPSS